MGIEAYSTNPNANTVQMPEGQAPSTVNNGVRDVQAAIAADYNDPGWYRPGAPAPAITRLSANSFRIPGVDVTAIYHAGRRVRVQGATTGTVYGRVDSSVYTGGNTDVTATPDAGTIQAEDLTVSLGRQGTSASTALPLGRQSWPGILELLNATEYQTGTDTVRALTVATMVTDWVVDLTVNHKRILIRLPFGIKIEIGRAISNTEIIFQQEFNFPPAVVCSAMPDSGVSEIGQVRNVTETRCGVFAFTYPEGTLTGSAVAYIAAGT